MVVARKTSVGTRGKYAEGKVKELLELAAQSASFTYYRPPDARSGSKKESPGDFLALQLHGESRIVTLIEVKEVGHAYRLPKKNFPQEQRARMRKWVLAGAQACVLVYHTPTNEWRYLHMNYFAEDFSDSGSWDLSNVDTSKLKDIIGTMI